MTKQSRSQQRAQRNLRIMVIIFSLLIIISMVLSLLPPPR